MGVGIPSTHDREPYRTSPIERHSGSGYDRDYGNKQMPYTSKGKCAYKKNPDGSRGKKVGCTKGSTKDYLAALHSQAQEGVEEEIKESRRMQYKEAKRLGIVTEGVSKMKIKPSRMKEIINEEVARFVNQEGGDDDEQFFADLLFDERIDEVGAGEIALGLILGYLAYKAYGPAKNIARNILWAVGENNKRRALASAESKRSENLDALMVQLSEDQELIGMLQRMEELTGQVEQGKGQRTPEMKAARAELKAISPQITSYVDSIKLDFERPQKKYGFGKGGEQGPLRKRIKSGTIQYEGKTYKVNK